LHGSWGLHTSCLQGGYMQKWGSLFCLFHSTVPI
jgi:hypothetical protein